MHFRRFPIAFFALVLTLTLALLGPKADAVEIVEPNTYSTDYGFLNCNDAIYSKGVIVNGVDTTWTTGSGTTKKYIRAQRMVNLFKTQPNLSLFALTECSTTMLQDLAKLMGPTWKYVGGDPSAHNKNGWLYDNSKWYPGNLGVTNLPGSQGRRLLQIGWFLRVPGVADPMLSTATTHFSSGDPESRKLQVTAVINKIGGATRLVSGDLNASSYPYTTSGCELGDPRYQLKCAGYTDFGHEVPSWHEYGKQTNPLPLDYIGLSKGAVDSERITMSNKRVVDTLPTYVADHRLLVAQITFVK